MSHLAAAGKRALVGTGWQGIFAVVDASSAQPRIVRTVDLVGYPSDIELTGSVALVSLGMDGLATVDLSE